MKLKTVHDPINSSRLIHRTISIQSKVPGARRSSCNSSRSSKLRRKIKAASMGNEERKKMNVVRGLDLQRYVGRWYEMASIPSFFQPRDGVNTRATYTLNADGTVHVLNETWSSGKRDTIQGTAYKADPNNDEAKFKVKFYVPPFLPIIPVLGNYWVLYIDQNYQFVLVGEPTRKYLWILCRQIYMDDATYNQLLEKAQEEGYDVKKLHKTPQANPPPESDVKVPIKRSWMSSRSASNIQISCGLKNSLEFSGPSKQPP